MPSGGQLRRDQRRDQEHDQERDERRDQERDQRRDLVCGAHGRDRAAPGAGGRRPAVDAPGDGSRSVLAGPYVQFVSHVQFVARCAFSWRAELNVSRFRRSTHVWPSVRPGLAFSVRSVGPAKLNVGVSAGQRPFSWPIRSVRSVFAHTHGPTHAFHWPQQPPHPSPRTRRGPDRRHTIRPAIGPFPHILTLSPDSVRHRAVALAGEGKR